jgi:hypothetical protein
MALSASVAPTAALVPVAPSWRNDYTLALQEGRNTKRPLAIFVASGPDGWDKLSKEGGLDKEAKELLRSNYVCVYLDASKASGQKLAEQLDLSNGSGVVIGDVTGQKQAFWHAGAIKNEDLNRYLRKYSDPERVVARTETVAETRPQPAPTYRSAPTYQAQPAPTYYQQPAYSPSVFRSFGGCST